VIRAAAAPRLADIAAHYDDLDAVYREVWGEHVHHGVWWTGRENPETAVEELIRHVAARAALRRGDRVCDVGCGYGATGRYLARAWGVRVTGCTLSAAQASFARAARRPGELVRVRLVDWIENRLPSSHFDAALAVESLAHMDDKRRALGEMHRVLRPRGRAVVCAWMAAERVTAWKRRWLLEPICREGRLAGIASAREYARLVDTAGLTLLSFEDLSRQVERTWTLCALRAMAGLLDRPDYRRHLLNRRSPHRSLAVALVRMRLAYAAGAMRYGVLTAEAACRRARGAALTTTGAPRRP
jgi:tocopherol O-methyltransferase